MKRPLSTLKSWFRRGLKPTESQFSDWLDSFWHKDEELPAVSEKYTNLTPMPTKVGGWAAGSIFDGKTNKEMWDGLLQETTYPTLTNPSIALQGTLATLFEAGENINQAIQLNLSRGLISPAYGTSGFRSGAFITYTFDGRQGTITGNSISINFAQTPVLEQPYILEVRANYGVGEQPKDSKGNNYQLPLSAGQLTWTRTVYGVFPFHATTADIRLLTKQSLINYHSVSNAIFSLVAETTTGKQTIQSPVEITGFRVENPLAPGTFEYIGGSAAMSLAGFDQNKENINGKDYYFYKHNGVQTGARRIQIEF